ncbi:MAG TPA: glycosyltransferase family 4 protein [Tepidisphaeraceae bacterium]|nr:glycosyltransferase family 4 protein [Tepidisphaeraceae bacterium]
MKLAMVNQPWGQIEPPVRTGGSIPLILYELARRLARSCDTIYYTRSRFCWRQVVDQAVRYRYLPIVFDKPMLRALNRFGHFPDCRKPLFADRRAYFFYALQLALDVALQRCDVIHIVNMSQFVPVVRRLNPQARIVLHMECEWLNQLDREMVRCRLLDCDLILGCSDFITNKVRARYPELAQRCQTLYNGADVDRIGRSIGSGHGRSSRSKNGCILFVGRITPEKGVHTLLEAFDRIAPQFPEARLVIVGPEEINPPELVVPFSDDPKVYALAPLFAEGRPYRALVEKLSARWRDRIRFTGNLPHGDPLDEQYRSADICVIPSVWEEPFGMPVVEAMAAGKPVIATRGGAFPELVVHEQTGLLVERGDPVELADAIARLLSDQSLRLAMGQAARLRAVELFSWDRIAGQLRGYYDQILAGQPSSQTLCAASPPASGQPLST